MKKMIVILTLGLFSYPSFSENNQIDNQRLEGYTQKNTEYRASDEKAKAKQVLTSVAFLGDSSIESIESQAADKARQLGASSYRIIGVSGENKLRGHVIFYK